ncbi:hypothetical protein B0H63DRAFT_466274 [Podospora didyma]|uniref:HD domain-containing protein n=1 Tax=Podospora didyma TaxID=330526 RepID=A0AAE0NZV0_9PEZI|nr:hypothetical protein B0H63DRAFT_466274 [Podospora didyma]
MTLITDAVREELSTLYSGPSRFYHNLSHVDTLLKLLNQHRSHFTDPDAIEAAIWFHDAVYDSRAKGDANEVASADLAVAHLREGQDTSSIDADRLEKIRVMIVATATHTVPSFVPENTAAEADAALFLDMDLSILGAGEDVFAAYEAAVRKEYSWVDDDGWREGRSDVLARFLAREYIYHSVLFRRLYEAPARRNLEESLRRLAA